MFVDVIIDRPLPTPLVYRLGETPAGGDVVGSCVVVPLGRQETIGIVAAINAAPTVDPAKVRAVRRVLAGVPPLSAHWLALTRFAADYYQHAWGEVAVPALPPLMRRVPGARFEASLARARKAADTFSQAKLSAPLHLTSEQR